MGWRHESGRAELPRGEERDRALGLTPSTSEISCLGGGGVQRVWMKSKGVWHLEVGGASAFPRGRPLTGPGALSAHWEGMALSIWH